MVDIIYVSYVDSYVYVCVQEQEIREEEMMKGFQSYSARGDNPVNHRGFYKHKRMDSCFPNMSASLSRNGSKRSPSPSPLFLCRSMSRGSMTELNYRGKIHS